MIYEKRVVGKKELSETQCLCVYEAARVSQDCLIGMRAQRNATLTP